MALNNKNQINVLFSSGFRVFFPLGAIGAVVLLLYWVMLISGKVGYLPSYFAPISWHQHEMIFGVFAPIIIGFLFTAVPNWTGKPSPSGLSLALLALLYLIGRVAVFYSALLPVWLPILLDTVLLPMAIMGIAPAIFQTGNKRNYFLPIMLMVFAVFNLCSHLSAIGVMDFDENNFFIAALLFVVMLMNVIGGRVAPNFLKNKYPDAKQFNLKPLLPISMISIITVMISVIFEGPLLLSGGASLVAGLAILLRVIGWNGWVARRDPLMIILHIGVLWIAVGFFILGYAFLVDTMYIALSYHAFSVGAAGSLTLGVMSRAILGHSGRPIMNEKIITIMFLLINLSALSRILAPVYFVDQYLLFIAISGVCWVLAYVIFLIRFLPMVVLPRADGKPG